MGLLSHLMTGGLRATATPGPADDYWYYPVGSTTAAGVRLSPESAQKLSAWYRGRDLLATALAMLPLDMNKRLPNDGGRESADEHPLHDVLHRKPNSYQDSFTWRRLHGYHLIDHGNAYDRIVPGPRGAIDQLHPIHPSLVTPHLNDAGEHIYEVRNARTGQTTRHTSETIFHLMGASDDGVSGKGVLEYARDSIGLGVVLESYSSKLFSRGGNHGGFVEPAGKVSNEAMATFAESFLSKVGDWHVPKVLPPGSKFTPSTMDPEKAQLILSRKFTVNDIARWLGVPPHMIGDLDRATFTNIEHQGQEFVTYSLGPWLSLWEFAINDQLVLQPKVYYAEFVREALVRGDIATRWATYVSGTNAGILAINEVRVKENLPKVPGGDKPREPANITGNRRTSEGQPPSRPTRQEPKEDRAEAIVMATAARVLKQEINAVRRLAVKYQTDGDAFASAVTEFYADHVSTVMEMLVLNAPRAQDYCAGQSAQILTPDSNWLDALALWKQDDYAAGLAALALEEAA